METLSEPSGVRALTQVTLFATLAGDMVVWLAAVAGYGWASMAALQAGVLSTTNVVLTTLGPLSLALAFVLLGVLSSWALSAGKPWGWLLGVVFSALHLAVNPCCSPLALLLLGLLLHADNRALLDAG